MSVGSYFLQANISNCRSALLRGGRRYEGLRVAGASDVISAAGLHGTSRVDTTDAATGKIRNSDGTIQLRTGSKVSWLELE